MKLTYLAINQPAFLESFDRLGAEELPVKERYALARTRRDIAKASETYEGLRIDLIKRLGIPEIDLRKRQLSELPEGSPMRKQLEDRIKFDTGNVIIDPEDKAANETFVKEFKELQEIEFDVFLDHKIALSDSAKLYAKDITVLLDIIDVP